MLWMGRRTTTGHCALAYLQLVVTRSLWEAGKKWRTPWTLREVQKLQVNSNSGLKEEPWSFVYMEISFRHLSVFIHLHYFYV